MGGEQKKKIVHRDSPCHCKSRQRSESEGIIPSVLCDIKWRRKEFPFYLPGKEKRKKNLKKVALYFNLVSVPTPPPFFFGSFLFI